MLKIIATARSECTTKYENMTSYNTDYIVSGLIDIFGDDWKEIRKQIKRPYVPLKNSSSNFKNKPQFKRSACFYVAIIGDFERFCNLNFETSFLKN